MVVLKVLTLNCWGIELPIVCKYRRERFTAIGDVLGKGDYDIIFLQEVWSNSDYKRLGDKLGKVLPYSHYFHSGAIGSGVCVFSKFPITETLFHRFQINGFPHKIHHGDWFGGKGLGLCQIQVEDITMNLYITHLHAEYCQTNDIYMAHRISQAFESSQFIKHSSHNCDVVIFAGDLNLRSDDLGYKIIISTGGLADSWVNKKSMSTEGNGATCELKLNSFTSPSTNFPDGQRIDYILYRYNKGCNVSIEDCNVLFHKVPGKPYDISDHQAVTATIKIEKSESQGLEEKVTAVGRNQHLEDALEILEKGMEEIQNARKYFAILTVLFVALLYIISSCDDCLGCMLIPFATLIKIGMIVAITFFIGYGLIVKLSEENALYSIKCDILNLLQKPVKD